MTKQPFVLKSTRSIVLWASIILAILLIYRIAFFFLSQSDEYSSFFNQIEFLGKSTGFSFFRLSNFLFYAHLLLLGLFTMRVYHHYHTISRSSNIVGSSNALISWLIPIAKSFMPFYFLFYGFRAYRVLCFASEELLNLLSKIKTLFVVWMLLCVVTELPRMVRLLFSRFIRTDLLLSDFYGMVSYIKPFAEFGAAIFTFVCLWYFSFFEKKMFAYIQHNKVSNFQEELSAFGKKKKESDFE